MANSLFTLVLKGKRDLLRARQLVRRAVDLLGFDGTDQMCVAAAAFNLACQAQAVTGRAQFCCEIVDDCLNIVGKPVVRRRQSSGPMEQSAFRIVKKLPAGAAMPREDVAWMLKQLAELAPVDLFDEMIKVNQELLQLLLATAKGREAREEQAGPNAA
jgi:hypothetical protein